MDTKNSKIKQSLGITFDNVNAELESVTVDGIADLSTADFEYDGSALKLNGNFNKITEEKKKITAVFTLTAKNSGETLTKTTETVEAQIVAVKELTGTDLGNQLKNMSAIMPNIYYTFPSSSPTVVSDTEFKIVNNSSKPKESPTTKLKVADFVVELKDTLNKYITRHEADAYFTGYTLNEVPKINDTIAEFTIAFNIKVEYEFSGEYKITVDAKTSDDNINGSWEQQ